MLVATAKNRLYRLAKAEADATHAEPWDGTACARILARVGLFLRRGTTTGGRRLRMLAATDADDLAERLHRRASHSQPRGALSTVAK